MSPTAHLNGILLPILLIFFNKDLLSTTAHFQHVGCYQILNDNGNLGVLMELTDNLKSQLTPDVCLRLCVEFNDNRNKVLNYFGLFNGEQCYCRDTVGIFRLASFDCMASCPGNWQISCGGSKAMDIYFIEWENPPVLQTSMSHYNCAVHCLHLDVKLAGVTNRTSCYCGSGLVSSAVRASAGVCGRPCTGNQSEICGDAEYMLVMKVV
uniref:WSC domain-containing protein n=1 Tax=Macrostomum lignano TaxID=282301 RepID=A0A1I8H5W6_9PLAT